MKVINKSPMTGFGSNADHCSKAVQEPIKICLRAIEEPLQRRLRTAWEPAKNRLFSGSKAAVLQFLADS